MLLWYANISIAVARPGRNSQIRPVNVPFEESGSPCSAAEKGSMTREKNTEVTIHLNNLHGLFAQPVIDPFSKKALCISGIELIKSELTSTTWGSEAIERAIIFLPKECIEPGLAQKITDALRRYCQFKAQQNRRAMVALRRQALIALLLGLLFLVCGLFLSQLLVRGTLLPPVINALFSDGFVIAFWVILWRPVDFFLFELWPFWREDRIYKRIMTMKITVAEEPAIASEQ